MSAGLDDEALALMALPRPRDRKWTSTGTWMGKGGHGKGEERDPWRLLRLEAVHLDAAAAAAVESVFVETLEPVDASLDLGVDRGEEASLLPDRRRRPRPCEQA